MDEPCRLLLVDDDEIILKGLARNIPWKEHGFEVVGSARNGREGLELSDALYPHLVISDIRMPFMDGLEFAQELRQRHPSIKLVFLTGYGDFEYAQKALSLKASSYVLKYASYDEILAAALQAREEGRLERAQRETAERGAVLIRDKDLLALLFGETGGPDPSSPAGALDLGQGPYTVAVVGGAFEDRAGMAAGEAWVARCREHLESSLATFELVLAERRIVVILHGSCSGSGEWARRELLESLAAELQAQGDEGIDIGVGGTRDEVGAIGESYAEALEALAIQKSIGPGGVGFYGQDIESENRQRARRAFDYVRKHFAEPGLGLVETAAQVGISPAYLSAVFKRYQGTTFRDFLISLRIEKAKELLALPSLPIYEISRRVGYPNAQYFSVLFRRLVGSSPGDFRSLRLEDSRPQE